MDRSGAGENAPDPETVFGTLDDPACRVLVETIDEPMTAKELSEAADVPLSTTYKKLERLQRASLVAESTEIDPEGHHRARYTTDFEHLLVHLDETREFAVEIERPLATPERRLVSAWSAVRNET